MIAIAGLRIIISNGLRRRETLIVATSLGLGLGVSYDPQIFSILPPSLYILAENPICVGGLTAIILNLLIPGGQQRSAANEEEPDMLADELEAMLDIPDAERDLPDMAMSAENKRVI